RRDVHAIWNTTSAQVVFTDTPGFHKPQTLLGVRLNDLVGDAVEGVDVVVQVVDAAAGVGRGDAFVYQQKVRPAGARSICVVNKIDALHGHAEVPQLAAAGELGAFDEVTDQPLETRLAEVIREKALHVTHQEVPHSIAVVIEETEHEDGLMKIHATLVVERDSQK